MMCDGILVSSFFRRSQKNIYTVSTAHTQLVPLTKCTEKMAKKNLQSFFHKKMENMYKIYLIPILSWFGDDDDNARQWHGCGFGMYFLVGGLFCRKKRMNLIYSVQWDKLLGDVYIFFLYTSLFLFTLKESECVCLSLSFRVFYGFLQIHARYSLGL